MLDRRYQIAGTLDLLLRNKEGRIALCDYKTKDDPKKGKKINKGNYKTQLGGYLSLLGHQFPQIVVDTCRIYYVCPSRVESVEYPDTLECLQLYERARSNYFEKQLPF